jgi:hypothetical protein
LDKSLSVVLDLIGLTIINILYLIFLILKIIF